MQGVPLKAPVAGIAMGLIEDGGNFSILSDIQGMEDALGDMDFKGSRNSKGHYSYSDWTSRYMACPAIFFWQH